MVWKFDDSIPIWPQIKEQITRGIVTGEYEAGASFPAVRQLAEEAGVNRNTMQRALAELENDGLLITNRTAGRTVTSDAELIGKVKDALAEETVRHYFEQMEALGYSEEEAAQLAYRKGKIE